MIGAIARDFDKLTPSSNRSYTIHGVTVVVVITAMFCSSERTKLVVYVTGQKLSAYVLTRDQGGFSNHITVGLRNL